jgi:hypothetical protein
MIKERRVTSGRVQCSPSQEIEELIASDSQEQEFHKIS